MNTLNATTQQACNDLLGTSLVIDGAFGPESNTARTTLLQKLKYIFSANKYVWGSPALIGIRMSDIFTDEFTDYGLILIGPNLYAFPMSTKPGASYLLKPENAAGCACLAEGQYLNMWKFQDTTEGFSGEPYCQQIGVCTIYRQKNKNIGDTIDRTIPNKGIFGINFHTWRNFNGAHVKNLSAGCQVMDEAVLVGEILGYIRTFVGDIDYTLLHKNDF